MRKGEEKRQELLNAAEKLFCSRGYEATSVQDMMQSAGLSKGGFYHHFASKEDVIKALCVRRAQRAEAYAEAELATADTSMGRINAVLHSFIPLRREEADFVSMLLPLIAKPEGRAIAMTYQDALAEAFLPMLAAEVAAAAATDVVCPPVKDVERIILHTINHCWMDILAMLTRDGERRPERIVLLNLLNKYRRTVEVLLDAPYGSVEILRVEELDEIIRMLAN